MIVRNFLPHCSINLIGRQPRLFPRINGAYHLDKTGWNTVQEKLHTLNISKELCLLRVASDESVTGFQTLLPWQHSKEKSWLEADGVILYKQGQVGLFTTADCPAVIFSNSQTKMVLAVHAGRPALTPNENSNVITRAIKAIASSPEELQSVLVYITGGICGRHFQHNQGDKPNQAQPFLDSFGEAVFTDVKTLALDLKAVITLQLIAAGIPASHITQDDACTFENLELSSHRREGADRTTANLIVVTKQ
jgi:copper oxidase (laccase) domain-containing protein